MQDKIATNTNLVVFNRERHMRKIVELVPLYANHGLKYLDLNFCEMMNPVSTLKDREKAKPYIRQLEDYKHELEVEYIQCHLPYPQRGQNPTELNDEIALALEYVERLEIPVSVIHPIKGNIEDNILYFENIAKFVPKCTTLAIENMESDEEIHSVEQLIKIVSSLSFKTGICLDTGHANIMNIDIPDFIKKANTLLIATHIADNNGKKDEHLLPSFGNIEWEKVIPTFKKYYNGYLNYEAMYFSRNVSESLSGEVIELSKAIGAWLLGL